ncbi:MAG: hypothetical protein H5T86_03050 [Armatimonadetes bacterium]|nr:hypothetical protein [Armatimonadota bacterium]
MSSDDFDIELDRAEEQVKKPVAGARPSVGGAQAPRAASAQKDGASSAGASPAQQRPPAVAMSSRRPGPFARAGDSIGKAVGHLRLPRLDAVTILYGLLALIVLALLAENWSPVRINLFGLYVDVPKAVAFVVNLGLGMLLLWAIQRPRRRRTGEATGGGEK